MCSSGDRHVTSCGRLTLPVFGFRMHSTAPAGSVYEEMSEIVCTWEDACMLERAQNLSGQRGNGQTSRNSGDDLEEEGSLLAMHPSRCDLDAYLVFL
jgi:hypothetical protein